MKTLLIWVVAAAAMLAAVPRANASPIAYRFYGASVSFGAAGTDTVTGSFVYDSSVPSGQLSNANITVAGPVYPSVSSVSYCPCGPNGIYFGPTGDILDYVIQFGSNLNGSAAPLTYGSFYNNSTPSVGPYQSYTVTGSVVPTSGLAPLQCVLGDACTITANPNGVAATLQFTQNNTFVSFNYTAASGEQLTFSNGDASDTKNYILEFYSTPTGPASGGSSLCSSGVFAYLCSTGTYPGSDAYTFTPGDYIVNVECLNCVTDPNINVELVSTTPLPSALPLFASGLAGLGLLGWRRKRKAQVG